MALFCNCEVTQDLCVHVCICTGRGTVSALACVPAQVLVRVTDKLQTFFNVLFDIESLTKDRKSVV